MKKILSIFLSLVLCMTVCMVGTVDVFATSTTYSISDLVGKYKTQGRTSIVDGMLMVDYSASGIEFSADCSGSVSIELEATSVSGSTDKHGIYFTVFVDGVMQFADLRIPEDNNANNWTSNSTNYPFYMPSVGSYTFEIATNLSQGVHTFEIYKQTPANKGVFGIKGITLNGTVLPASDSSDMLIEIVGDSIAAGHGNIANGGTSGENSLYIDATRGWGFLAAQQLEADWSILAQSGIAATPGVSWGGSQSGWPSITDVYPYHRYYSDKGMLHSFDRQADVIIVCLGTNDMWLYNNGSYGYSLTTDDVKQGFKATMTQLRQYNPNAKIIWVYGMMTAAADDIVKTAVAEMGGATSNFYSLPLTKNTSGGDGHPGLEVQSAYANAVVSFIKSIDDNNQIWDGSIATAYAGGDGTAARPYLIENGAQLALALKQTDGKNYKLTKDIYLNNLAAIDWTTGKLTDEAEASGYAVRKWTANTFVGNIDGDGHVIYGLYSENFGGGSSYWEGEVYIASLIKNIPANKTVNIKNTGVDNFYLAANNYCSAFVGVCEATSQLHVKNSFVGANGYMGGKYSAPFLQWGKGITTTNGVTLDNCYSLFTNYHDATAGRNALLGSTWTGAANMVVVRNCYAIGEVYFGNNTTVSNSYSVNAAKLTGVTKVTDSQMQGENAITNMPQLAYAFTASDTYPVLKAFSNKAGEYEFWNGSVSTSLAGSGTEEDPYLISDGADLAYAITNGGNDKFFKITEDIYLNSLDAINWNDGTVKNSSILKKWLTNNSSAPYAFSGTLDGDGHTVYGLYGNNYQSSWGNGWTPTDGAWAAGLIGKVEAGKKLTIKNLGFDSFNIHAGTYAGLVGCVDAAGYLTIDNCYVGANGQMQAYGAGSFLGVAISYKNANGITINNSYSLLTNLNSKGAATRTSFTGVSWFNGGTVKVSNCYAVGNIIAASAETATNCYSQTQTGKTGVTNLTEDKMTSGAPIVYMASLGNAFVTTDAYPTQPIFVKDVDEYKNFTLGYFEGSGTSADPYLISTGVDLYKAIGIFGQNKYYKLTNDIYLNDIDAINWTTGAVIKDGYTPLVWFKDSSEFAGHYEGLYTGVSVGDTGIGFQGTIDGNGYAVYGVYYDNANTSRSAGLIPASYQTSTNGGASVIIKNLGLKYSHIGSAGRTGGFVGNVMWGVNVTLDKCFIDETTTVRAWQTASSYTNNGVGGLVGYLNDSGKITLTDCAVYGNVTNIYPASTAEIWTPQYVGGLYYWANGSSRTATISNCFTVIQPYYASSATLAVSNVYYETVTDNFTKTIPATFVKLTKEQMTGANAVANMEIQIGKVRMAIKIATANAPPLSPLFVT